jgi:hypothetical protein
LGKFCLKFDITKNDEKIENPKKRGRKKKKKTWFGGFFLCLCFSFKKKNPGLIADSVFIKKIIDHKYYLII